ncbi:MAG: hydrogenase expression/formation protein HypE [Nitrospirae bacterium]|jgi:hydrogenase expression/formation protein HypE|nr:hydrogenase expression/formation protein HypE [Nitrospirota bacterium]
MERILLSHGSGGKLMYQLIRDYFAPEFEMKSLNDSAVLEGLNKGNIALTTDSYVVSPIFFPGGNIGELSVYGTVNDLSMVGAMPLYITAGLILEEGFPIEELKKILSSMSKAAENAGVKIVAGDTKVVNKGKADGIFINTSGVGIIEDGVEVSPKKVKPGDKVILSGPVGNHGISIIAERNGISFNPPVLSDTAPLNGLVREILDNTREIHAMRDPTRGGVATTLKEIAIDSGYSIIIEEDYIPVPSGVKGACELLGLDPLYVANEGILIAIVDSDVAELVLKIMKGHTLGREACFIGEVKESPAGMVLLKTSIGGTRIVEMLSGDQLPRIC